MNKILEVILKNVFNIESLEQAAAKVILKKLLWYAVFLIVLAALYLLSRETVQSELGKELIGNIVRDIPFAARLLEKNAVVINDRGFEFTSDNIKSKLSERDIMKSFYESGLAVQGLKSYGKKEAFDFANRFDAVLTRMEKVARDQT